MLPNTLSDIGSEVLRSREGLKLTGYLDSVGVPTIGWGHTGKDVFVGKKISKAEAIRLFNLDVSTHAAPINRLVKKTLTENQYDALVSFLYNVGEGNFKKSSLLKAINRGDFEQAAKEFDKWHIPTEVTTRRDAERDQFKTPYSVALPKGRSNDAKPIKRPVAAPQAAPVASQAPTPVKPASMSVGGALASLWAKLNPPKTPALPPGADPIVWNAQKLMKERNYMTAGKIDGFDGTLTRDAVAAIRKDNGMGDGGMDDEFLKLLPTFGPRPVSKERSEASNTKAYAEAKQQAPDLVAPVATLWKGGLGSLLFGGAGMAQVSGTLDTLKDSGDKASDVLSTIQSTFATIASVVQFIVTHWQWFAIAFGLYWLLKAANGILGIVIRYRQARGI